MIDFGFYNMDCMDGMKHFPDNYFDLAIVDPPYGDGKLSENSGGNGTDLVSDSTGISMIHRGVARQAEVLPRCTSNERTSGNQTKHVVMRTGGTWASKYAKKLSRGTWRRPKSIFKNSFASHGIK